MSNDLGLATADDAISLLEHHIEHLVRGFADGHEVIKISMKQDRSNAASLAKMEQKLRELGNHGAANRLVSHSRDASNHSLNQVLPMRRHIEDIAKLLNEMVNPEIQTDAMSLKAVMEDIRRQSDAARGRATAGKQKLEAFAGQLLEIQAEYQGIGQKAEEQIQVKAENAEEHHRIAQRKRTQRNVSGFLSAFASVALGTAKAGMEDTLCAGGVKLALGSYLTNMSAWFSTTALGLCGICCVISIKLGLAARDAYSKYEMALQSQKAAEREVEQSKGLVEKSEESQASAHEMVATAMAHESLWSGVSAAAELVAHSFSELRQIDPTGLRRRKFNEKMKASSAELLNFVQAIDEYLFFLHKQDFFPPTFHLQRALGQEKFRKMEEDWQAAAAQVAQSTEQSELETGHGRQNEMLCC